MRILTRYIFREFCVPFGYCLTGFMAIYVLFELFASFSRLSAAKVGFVTAVEYLAGYLAPYFEWLAPACLMLATLYTMWNFCRHSELIAMRAGGIGFLTIVKPILFAAVCVAAFTFWVNERYVPTHAQWAKQFRAAHFKTEEMAEASSIIYHDPDSNRTWEIGIVTSPHATAFENVKVAIDDSTGARIKTITAERAEHLDGVWCFYSPHVTYFTKDGAEKPSPTPELDALSLRTFPEFDEQPRDFLLQNCDWAYLSVSDRLRFLATHPSLSAERRTKYRYDAWSQLVAPLACIIITLFAIPAGVATGRQSVFKGVVTALGMFFAFYALTIGCMVLANCALLPPLIAAILPDIIFLIIGCIMFHRQR